MKYFLIILVISMLAMTRPSNVVALRPMFSDGFENANSFADLFQEDLSRWTNYNITVDGNYVELSQERARSGLNSLKCYAVPFDEVTASKALISCDIFKFVEGSRAWFEMWYFIETATPTPNLFIWDFEAQGTCTQLETCPEVGDGSICSSPGRRLYLQNSIGTPVRSDLGKWCLGEVFAQKPGSEVLFPTNQWVQLRVYIELSSSLHGSMQVWQDGVMILNNQGYTLPRADSICSRIEVGITATGGTEHPVTLFLDDVTVWDTRPIWWNSLAR